MRTVDIIAKKRDGKALSRDEIDFFVQGFTAGEIPDYQAAAWSMSVLLRGMDARETADLTWAMAHSGETLDLSSVASFVVDKHSTGGVGDKTTLVVAPLVSAARVPVGKMTGRGLGFSGGTVDKLESIPGFHADLSVDEFMAQLRDVGIVVAGQTADLAPADGKLYALRDVTSTVESIPLIASSIMSKKIAAGANGIVLDVKVGLGAFMHTEEQAEELARAMVAIGQQVGRRVVAVISDMNQPLGCAVGNALEVREAIATLQGHGPPDLFELCLTVASQMVLLAERCQTEEECRALLRETLRSGAALERFRDLVRAQGGDPSVVEHPEKLPQARLVKQVRAFWPGYVETIDAMEVGLTVALLGAGRVRKDEPIDPAVGLVLAVKVGDRVEEGQLLYTVHANDEERLAQAERRLQDAVLFSSEPVTPPPLIHRIIGTGTPR